MKLQDEKLEQLVEAIKAINLSESTIAGDTGTGAGVTNIETSDQNLSLPDIYQELQIPSLAKSVLFNSPLNGPSGALFNIRKKEGTDVIELLRSDVEVFPSSPKKTEITKEALEDIMNHFGIDGVKSIATMLQGLANSEENVKFLEFLDNNAVEQLETFQLVSKNSWECFYELNKRVSETVLKMNSTGVKTFRASIVLPYKLASTVMGLPNGDSKSLSTPSTYYVGGTELQDFFINPDPTAEMVYVVLNDKYDGSKGAGVYSPYQNFINTALDSETGEHVYFIYNRFALGLSPLHSQTKPSIMSFKFIED